MKNKLVSSVIIGFLLFSGISSVIINNIDLSADVQLSPTVIMFGGSAEENNALSGFTTNFPLAQVSYFPNLKSDHDSNTNPVVYIGHSSEAGILYNGLIIPWTNVLSMILNSESENHYFLGCDSHIITLLSHESGKNVMSFDRKVDAIAGVAYISFQISIKEGLGILSSIGYYMAYNDRLSQIRENPALSMLLPVFLPPEGGGGGGGGSSDTGPPTAPNSFSTSIDVNNIITLSWETPDDLNGAYAVIYEVFRSSSALGTYYRIYTIDDTFVSISQDFSSTYYYKVRAVTVYGESSYSNRDSITTGVDPTEASANCDILIVNDPVQCTGITGTELTFLAASVISLLLALAAPAVALGYAYTVTDLVGKAILLGRASQLGNLFFNAMSLSLITFHEWDEGTLEGADLAIRVVAIALIVLELFIKYFTAYLPVSKKMGALGAVAIDKASLMTPLAWLILAAHYAATLYNAYQTVDSAITDWND